MLNEQNKQDRPSFWEGFVQTPTFIMHAVTLNYFTQIVTLLETSMHNKIMYGAVRIYHQNLISLILLAFAS